MTKKGWNIMKWRMEPNDDHVEAVFQWLSGKRKTCPRAIYMDKEAITDLLKEYLEEDSVKLKRKLTGRDKVNVRLLLAEFYLRRATV